MLLSKKGANTKGRKPTNEMEFNNTLLLLRAKATRKYTRKYTSSQSSSAVPLAARRQTQVESWKGGIHFCGKQRGNDGKSKVSGEGDRGVYPDAVKKTKRENELWGKVSKLRRETFYEIDWGAALEGRNSSANPIWDPFIRRKSAARKTEKAGNRPTMARGGSH
jgi:hypothetical protein